MNRTTYVWHLTIQWSSVSHETARICTVSQGLNSTSRPFLMFLLLFATTPWPRTTVYSLSICFRTRFASVESLFCNPALVSLSHVIPPSSMCPDGVWWDVCGRKISDVCGGPWVWGNESIITLPSSQLHRDSRTPSKLKFNTRMFVSQARHNMRCVWGALGVLPLFFPPFPGRTSTVN